MDIVTDAGHPLRSDCVTGRTDCSRVRPVVPPRASPDHTDADPGVVWETVMRETRVLSIGRQRSRTLPVSGRSTDS